MLFRSFVPLTILLCIVSGCAEPAGVNNEVNNEVNNRVKNGVRVVTITNESPSAIWMDAITGVYYAPECGLYAAGGGATYVGSSQQVASKVTIRWWKGDEKHPESKPAETEVDFGEGASSKQTKELDLILTSEFKWIGKFATE